MPAEQPFGQSLPVHRLWYFGRLRTGRSEQPGGDGQAGLYCRAPRYEDHLTPGRATN